jgi:exopolysaccharide biosynthesis predicted pyruvyltransferase EpsI
MGFTEGFKSREAPVTLFCREQYSWRHLKEDHQLPKYCSIGLDHDTAFELQDDPLVTNRLNRPPKHVLICERGDLEHPTNSAGFWEDPTKPVRRSLKTKLVRNIPVAIKKPFYPLKAMARSRKATPFRRYCEQKIQDEWKQFKDLPHLRCDVSDRSLGSFDEFCDRIADSAVVFSTRLHVGIFAAMLGKPTYIFEGPYHKIRAIYEHSMADLAHVNFVSRDDLR